MAIDDNGRQDMNAGGLQALDEGLWIADAPLSMLGIRVGTRMTVVRLTGGDLWLHSPVPMKATLRDALDRLGRVRFIVAPNRYHHLFVGAAAAAWPDAEVHGAPGLDTKRSDLQFDAVLGAVAEPPWAGDIEQLAIEGTLLHETVFFHPASRTLITSDLAEHRLQSDHWPTRVYARLCGVTDRFAVPWLLRVCYREKARARDGIRRLLEWDFDRVILAHGEIVESGGKALVQNAYRWLLDD